MLASLFLRATQMLTRRGHHRAAWALRMPCGWLTGADFVPGCEVGPGAYITHPTGLTLGSRVRIGEEVTFGVGVALGGLRSPDYVEEPGEEKYSVIGDRVFLGAHAVVLIGVEIGDDAVVGANSVVRTDVKPGSIVSGVPAEHVAQRKRTGGPLGDPAT
jgi:serine O-acetyltransferase